MNPLIIALLSEQRLRGRSPCSRAAIAQLIRAELQLRATRCISSFSSVVSSAFAIGLRSIAKAPTQAVEPTLIDRRVAGTSMASIG